MYIGELIRKVQKPESPARGRKKRRHSSASAQSSWKLLPVERRTVASCGHSLASHWQSIEITPKSHRNHIEIEEAEETEETEEAVFLAASCYSIVTNDYFLCIGEEIMYNHQNIHARSHPSYNIHSHSIAIPDSFHSQMTFIKI